MATTASGLLMTQYLKLRDTLVSDSPTYTLKLVPHILHEYVYTVCKALLLPQYI